MMLLPSRERFIHALRSGDGAYCTFTATDDLGIAADAVRAAAREAGVSVRIFPSESWDTWQVWPRAYAHGNPGRPE